MKVPETFDTIDAALDRGRNVALGCLKERYGQGVRYDLEVARQAIEYADLGEVSTKPLDSDAQMQDDTDIRRLITAATREIWQKLKISKVGRQGAADNMLDEILRIGVPMRLLVRMVESLANAKKRCLTARSNV